MIDLPDNWERCESEYNRNYDPYASKCPQCGAEDSDVEDGEQIYCMKCGYVFEDNSL